jgi:hypothetical protein
MKTKRIRNYGTDPVSHRISNTVIASLQSLLERLRVMLAGPQSAPVPVPVRVKR